MPIFQQPALSGSDLADPGLSGQFLSGQFSGPDFSGNACALLSLDEREALWQAACLLIDQRGLVVRITGFVGRQAEWAGGRAAELGTRVFGENWESKLRGYAETALWQAQDLAVLGMDGRARRPWNWLNKVLSSASGAAGGFFGLPGMAIDIPVSTLMIMRSVAEIARSHGEDISSEDGRRACLEVIAFGGPTGEDDDIDIAYWSTRAAFMHTALDVAIRQAAGRLGVVLSEKALAQIVPIAGAVAGGSLNYIFMDYYQQMARVHFSVRAVERRHGGDGAVRACLDQLIRQARARPRSA